MLSYIAKATRALSLVVVVLHFCQSVALAHAAENNFWLERRRHTHHTGAQPLPQITLDLNVKPMAAPAIKSALPEKLRWLGALAPYGTVRHITPGKNKSNKLVIHVQDVHQNLDAQKNIGRALQELLSRRHIALVALEGTNQPLDLSRFRRYPRHATVTSLADHWLKEGDISGPIHTALTSAPNIPPMIGVDDALGHQQNVEAYLASRSLMENNLAILHRLERDWAAASTQCFNRALLAFDAKTQSYHHGQTALGRHLQDLMDAAPSSTRWEKFPTLQRFSEALALEKAIDFKRTEQERSRLIETLAQKLAPDQIRILTLHSLAYQQRRLAANDFYQALQTLCQYAGVPLNGFKSMRQYMRYVRLADSVDGETFFRERDSAERMIYKTLARSSGERELLAKGAHLRLVGKLLEFKLTNDEWREYLHSPAATEGLSLRPFEDFYRFAKKREAAMAQGTLRGMTGTDAVAVLVTGGFHADGLRQRLKESGVTVVSFTPRIEKIETNGAAVALGVFSQEKTPLEKLTAGDSLFLAPHPARPLAAGTHGAHLALFEELADPRVDNPNDQSVSDAVQPGGPLVAVHDTPTGAVARVRRDGRPGRVLLSAIRGAAGGVTLTISNETAQRLHEIFGVNLREVWYHLPVLGVTMLANVLTANILPAGILLGVLVNLIVSYRFLLRHPGRIGWRKYYTFGAAFLLLGGVYLLPGMVEQWGGQTPLASMALHSVHNALAPLLGLPMLSMDARPPAPDLDNVRVVVFGGGSSTRFHPFESKTLSEVVSDSGRSLLDQTLDRLQGPWGKRAVFISPNHVTVLAGDSSAEMEQHGPLSGLHVLTEPSRRGTFPALLWALANMSEEERRKNPTVVTLFGDNYMKSTEGFQTTLAAAIAEAQGPGAPLVEIGIDPHAKYMGPQKWLSLGLGKYSSTIQPGTHGRDILLWREKDSNAAALIAQGNCYLSSGMIAAKVQTIERIMGATSPKDHNTFLFIHRAIQQGQTATAKWLFNQLPAKIPHPLHLGREVDNTIAYALLTPLINLPRRERPTSVKAIMHNSDWADIASLDDIGVILQKDDEGNSGTPNVAFLNVKESIGVASLSWRLTLIDLQDLVVAVNRSVLVVRRMGDENAARVLRDAEKTMRRESEPLLIDSLGTEVNRGGINIKILVHSVPNLTIRVENKTIIVRQKPDMASSTRKPVRGKGGMIPAVTRRHLPTFVSWMVHGWGLRATTALALYRWVGAVWYEEIRGPSRRWRFVPHGFALAPAALVGLLALSGVGAFALWVILLTASIVSRTVFIAQHPHQGDPAVIFWLSLAAQLGAPFVLPSLGTAVLAAAMAPLVIHGGVNFMTDLRQSIEARAAQRLAQALWLAQSGERALAAQAINDILSQERPLSMDLEQLDGKYAFKVLLSALSRPKSLDKAKFTQALEAEMDALFSDAHLSRENAWDVLFDTLGAVKPGFSTDPSLGHDFPSTILTPIENAEQLERLFELLAEVPSRSPQQPILVVNDHEVGPLAQLARRHPLFRQNRFPVLCRPQAFDNTTGETTLRFAALERDLGPLNLTGLQIVLYKGTVIDTNGLTDERLKTLLRQAIVSFFNEFLSKVLSVRGRDLDSFYRLLRMFNPEKYA